MGIYRGQKNSMFRFIFLIFLFLSFCTSKKNQKLDDIFYSRFSSQPPTLHPIRSTDAYAYQIQQYVLESLGTRDLDTYQIKPHLAESWKISPDHLTYTFYLRKNIFWHDGRPLTADDVQFSVNAYQDVSYGGARWISQFENVSKTEVIDPYTVRFYAKEKHYGTFDKISLFFIIPKHIYKEKKTGMNLVLIGSGPYQLHEYKRNKKIVLKQNKKWWGRTLNSLKNQYNFNQIIYRIILDEHDALIRTAQGQIDFLPLSSESYFKKTNKPPWGKAVLKKKIQNQAPKGYSYIGWNLKKPLFQNKNVRKALSLLINRSLMNEKFYNNALNLISGPMYSQSDYADSDVQPILFSPHQALKLLSQNGWRDSDQNGILDKIENGVKKEFRFTLIFSNKEFEKNLTIYQEDLKTNGIIMSLKFMEWVSFLKMVDERNFDAVSLGWTSGVDWYPKQIWHSSSMGASNYISYNNPEVDRLINLADKELNRDARIKILKKVHKIIAEDQPYSFLFSPKYSFYAHSNRVEMDKPNYNYGLGIKYWRLKK